MAIFLLWLTGASQTEVDKVSCWIQVLSWWFSCAFPNLLVA